MPFAIIELSIAVGGLLIGSLITYLVIKPRHKMIEQVAQREATHARRLAEEEANRILENGKKQVAELRENFKREESQTLARFEKSQNVAEERLAKREKSLEERYDKLEESREEYKKLIEDLEKDKAKIQDQIADQTKELAKIAKMTKEDAKAKLFETIETEYSKEFSQTLTKKLDAMRQDSDEEASNILVQSIQRYASSVSSENTVSVVKLGSDDLKGKIIGREGRNINVFERLSGVDVIIDDTPGTITISCFDMFRRYIAKLALEGLLKDGRIHPARIEESLRKAEDSADKFILDIGKKSCQEVGISNLPEAILKLLGRLRFRTSYGQNVLQHSIEVAYLGQGIAELLPGADPEVCLKAGLLHDIGKAVSHEIEGGHAVIGKDILEKFGIEESIVTAMKSHHEDFPYESLEARVLQAADAISAARPGARRETLDKYIKRLKELENIANSFTGVDKAFAIQAGREVRIFVDAKSIDDAASEKMSFEIARKIEHSCEYPGEVRVSLIRENRFENIAA